MYQVITTVELDVSPWFKLWSYLCSIIPRTWQLKQRPTWHQSIQTMLSLLLASWFQLSTRNPRRKISKSLRIFTNMVRRASVPINCNLIVFFSKFKNGKWVSCYILFLIHANHFLVLSPRLSNAPTSLLSMDVSLNDDGTWSCESPLLWYWQGETYDLMSECYFTHASPTLFNATSMPVHTLSPWKMTQ